MAFVDFQPINNTDHLFATKNDDNQMKDHAFEKFFTYLVRVNGSYWEALKGGGAADAGTIIAGGQYNVDGVDGTVVLDVVQAAIDAVGAAPNYGTVYLKDIDEPAGLAIPANVMLLSFYANSTVGGNTCKTLYLDECRIGTRLDTTDGCNRQIIEIQSNRDTYGSIIHLKPNGTVTGEHRTGIACWNLFNQGVAEEICELQWSGVAAPNRWFLINTFASGTGAVYPIVFCAQAGDLGDALGGKVAEVSHGGGAGAQRFIIHRGLIPNNYPLSFLDSVAVQTAYIKFDSSNVFGITNLKNTDIVLTTGTGASPKYIRMHNTGDLALPNLQKVAFENAGATATTDFYQAADGTFVINHPEADNIQISVNGKYFYLTSNGDLQMTTHGCGLIMESANGTVYRAVINDAGAWVISAI